MSEATECPDLAVAEHSGIGVALGAGALTTAALARGAASPRRRPVLPLRLAPATALAAALAVAPALRAQSTAPIIGRWDLAVHLPRGDRPSWLEVTHSGNVALVGRFVGIVGSARPISSVGWSDNVVSFSIPTQWDPGSDEESLRGTLQADTLVGTFTDASGHQLPFSGHRAPTLRPKAPPAWGAPIRLLDGKDLEGWHVIQGESHWRVEPDGVLHNTRGGGGNIVTDRKFGDFQLHVEFKLPHDENSGVYLRGRYEAQLLDTPDTVPQNDILGSIYGFLPPSTIAARRGQWQTYDITLVGRMVTVVLNGTTVICNRAIPGPTGGALDSDEAAPGPIMLQGDHGPVEYRNIVIRAAK